MKKAFSWIWCGALWLAPILGAEESTGTHAPGNGNEIITGMGVLNVLDEDKRWAGMIEARSTPVWWRVRPWAGLMYAESQNYLISGGVVLTKQWERGWRVTAGWAPGYYHQGGGKNLGDPLEFYSFGEVAWVSAKGAAVLVRFGHISNGGLRDHNPGTEILAVGYSLPWGK